MSEHLLNIHRIVDVLKENDIQLDNIAYSVNRIEGDEIAQEIDKICHLPEAVNESKAGYVREQLEYKFWRGGWRGVHGAMYNGIRIAVVKP